MITIIVAFSCLLAIAPAALFLRNVLLYRPLPAQIAAPVSCSVLVPARNEEKNIADALRSILRSRDIDLEVIVLDDGSSDRTAEIVREFAATDNRVRLEEGRPLPNGWCGKNFACYQLARLARYPLLFFLDADVRVARTDSLNRLAAFVQESRASLVSGVPQQVTVGTMEKLIVPLIHFVLLGFLPMKRMRANTDPRFAAACGQIIAVRHDAYQDAGGHAAIAASLHDGLMLARRFRVRGCKTDLFDATNTFSCRMYRSAVDVWAGFLKNAQEGLAAPRLVVPATVILLFGQVFPICFLFLTTSFTDHMLAWIATVAVFVPRLIGVVRFRQSFPGTVLHPLGIALLVAIQCVGFVSSLVGWRTKWKGRICLPAQATKGSF
jgi:glycosyltransferase involved in cell wall biosynthesis